MPRKEGGAGLTCPGLTSPMVPVFSGIARTWSGQWEAWLDTDWQDSRDETDQIQRDQLSLSGKKDGNGQTLHGRIWSFEQILL